MYEQLNHATKKLSLLFLINFIKKAISTKNPTVDFIRQKKKLSLPKKTVCPMAVLIPCMVK